MQGSLDSISAVHLIRNSFDSKQPEPLMTEIGPNSGWNSIIQFNFKPIELGNFERLSLDSQVDSLNDLDRSAGSENCESICTSLQSTRVHINA